MTNVLFDWNDVPGSSLNYFGPVFNDGYPSRAHTVSKIGFPIAGFPDDVPGMATWGPGINHTWSYVYLNQSWTWNLTGVMDQGQKKADVHTVTLHEIGHSSGLQHPSVCGSMSAAEIASAMHPNYTKKWNLNSDDKGGLVSLY